MNTKHIRILKALIDDARNADTTASTYLERLENIFDRMEQALWEIALDSPEYQ